MQTIALDLALVALVPLVVVLALVLRRRLLVRSAGFEMALRVRRGDAARGWSFGVARYEGDRLLWFRTFSAWPAPSRVFRRGRLQVLGRREPTPAERAAVPPGHLVVECRVTEGDAARDVDLTMSHATLTGLLAWLESAPPGSDVAA